MWLMMQQDIPEDYVVCTGKTHTIQDFIDISFKEAGIDEFKKTILIDPEFYRPWEVDYLKGDCSKAKAELGW